MIILWLFITIGILCYNIISIFIMSIRHQLKSYLTFFLSYCKNNWRKRFMIIGIVYLQCCDAFWLIKKITYLASILILQLFGRCRAQHTVSPCSSSRSDSFEGQSQWEWDGPSDEHRLPSTSTGFLCLCCLITLQSSAGALRAVNYFAEQWRDVPGCEKKGEWER